MIAYDIALAVTAADRVSRLLDVGQVDIAAIPAALERDPSVLKKSDLVTAIMWALTFTDVGLSDDNAVTTPSSLRELLSTDQVSETAALVRFSAPNYDNDWVGGGTDLPIGPLGAIVEAVRIADGISRMSEEDYQGVWAFVPDLREDLPAASDELLREITHGIVTGLQDCGLVVVNGEFVEYPDQASAADHIAQTWANTGEDPGMDGPWLVRPPSITAG